VRFRPARLSAADVAAGLSCRFSCDGVAVGPLPILDLSTNGFGAAAPASPVLAPGSALESFELLADGQPIWSGEAVVVRGSGEHIGGRFTSGILDLQHFRLGATLDSRMALLREQRDVLPAPWRAAVADLRQLIEDVRFEMEGLEQAETHDPLRVGDEETELFTQVRARWGGAFYSALSELYAMSKGFDERAVALGHSYASSMLASLLYPCPMHRRAYDKPLGYAGDYRMMELCSAHELAGEGLYGRFLHSIAQNYTLVRAVRARTIVMQNAALQAIEADGEGPVRILALAAGPALELRRLLEEATSMRRPVELILLDQDRQAHESAYRQLSRILIERHRGALPVTIQCLHFSVRQLLKPQTAEDARVVEETLANIDLAYSAGLYDYLPEPVAAALTRLVFGRLRAGGRLLMGNLVETPDSTWVMEYVLGWPLVYRDDRRLLKLADGLSPARAAITRDSTERCIFLDVTRLTSP
jgi:extracellular factor (EF) 3-hydroxypalmitic acid methyl ester biosynthesis protein